MTARPRPAPAAGPRRTLLAAVLALLLALPAALAAGSSPAGRGTPAGRYVVSLAEGAGDPAALAALATRGEGRVSHVYRHALRGFAAELDEAALLDLRADPRVLAIQPDRALRLPPPRIDPAPPAARSSQVTPVGVLRVQANENPRFGPAGVDVDVAVVDTGVWAGHPDLAYAGGASCLPDEPDPGVDGYPHGTLVAGTIGAIDNDIGVVGVAPGARIWSVKVIRGDGSSSVSAIACGLDWVAARAGTIELANLSLGGYYAPKSSNRHCGRRQGDVLHQAVCGTVAAGVTVVAAAGNDCRGLGHWAPGGYPEAIAVGAFADSDGRPGGLGGPVPAFGCGAATDQEIANPDDALAAFTNQGTAVDLWAPGVMVLTTAPPFDGAAPGYAYGSGTSLASPHVAGVAALAAAAEPGADPARIRAVLAAGAEVSPLPNPWKREPWNGRRGPLAAAPVVNANPAGPWKTPG